MIQKTNFSSHPTKPGFSKGFQKAQNSRTNLKIKCLKIFKLIFIFIWTHIETQWREAQAFQNKQDDGQTKEIETLQQISNSLKESSHEAIIMQRQYKIFCRIFTVILTTCNTIKDKTVKIYFKIRKCFVQYRSESQQNKTILKGEKQSCQEPIETENREQTHNSSQIRANNENIQQTVSNTTNVEKNPNEKNETDNQKNKIQRTTLIKEDVDRQQEKNKEKTYKSQIQKVMESKEIALQKKVQKVQAQLSCKDSPQEKNIQKMGDCSSIFDSQWIIQSLWKMNNNSLLSKQQLLMMIQKIKNNSNLSNNKLSIQQVNQLILSFLQFIVQLLKKSESEVVKIEIYQDNGKGLSIQEINMKMNQWCRLVQDCKHVKPIRQNSNSAQKQQKNLARVRYQNNDRNIQQPPTVQSPQNLNQSTLTKILYKITECPQTFNLKPCNPEQQSNSNLFKTSGSFQNSSMHFQLNDVSNSKLLKTQKQYPDILKRISLQRNSIDVKNNRDQASSSPVGSSNASQCDDVTSGSNQSFQQAEESLFHFQSLIQPVIRNNQSVNPYAKTDETLIQNIVEIDTKCMKSNFYLQIKAVSSRQISKYEKFQLLTRNIQFDYGQDMLVMKASKKKRHNSHQLQLTYLQTKIIYVSQKGR